MWFLETQSSCFTDITLEDLGFLTTGYKFIAEEGLGTLRVFIYAFPVDYFPSIYLLLVHL